MSRDLKFPSAESDRPVHKASPEYRAFPALPGRPALPEAPAQLDRLVRRDRKALKALLDPPEQNGFLQTAYPDKTSASCRIITST
jgi:hypothetical protein